MFNKVQLITYIQRLGLGNIQYISQMLQSQLSKQFGGVHFLPFFYPVDGEDTGFDPIDHTTVDSRLGTWQDIKELASNNIDIMADLIVNHVSADSEEFQDYLRNGKNSQYADLFLSYSTVFPSGATEEDLLAIYRPRPGLPFTTYNCKNTESKISKKMMWTTFTSKQIDINVQSEEGKKYLHSILDTFSQSGVSIIRLDAVGYAIKKAGSSCFMLPETFNFIEQLRQAAHERNIIVLLEIHSHFQTQIEIAKQIDLVYDFCLPPLLLYTFYTKDPVPLKKWLDISPRNAITVLDTHDGIGIIDVGPTNTSEGQKPGLLSAEQIDILVNQIHASCNGESLESTGAAASNLDLYQVNATYYSALGSNDTRHLLSRLVQFFAPGIPQVYYVGYFFGKNDMQRLHDTKVGREINRHHFSEQEIEEHIHSTQHTYMNAIIQFRNSHPAFGNSKITLDAFTQQKDLSTESLFNSSCIVEITANNCFSITRTYLEHQAKITIDLENESFQLSWTSENNTKQVSSFEGLAAIDFSIL